MTEETFRVVLEAGQAKMDKEGWNVLPEGRLLTLYGGHNGAALTVAKVERVRLVQGIVQTVNAKRETFLLALEDVFAASIDGEPSSAAKRAGFFG